MFQKIFFTLVMSFLCFGVVAQEYEKKRGTIRLLTYNTHYCKGAETRERYRKKMYIIWPG